MNFLGNTGLHCPLAAEPVDQRRLQFNDVVIYAVIFFISKREGRKPFQQKQQAAGWFYANCRLGFYLVGRISKTPPVAGFQSCKKFYWLKNNILAVERRDFSVCAVALQDCSRP